MKQLNILGLLLLPFVLSAQKYESLKITYEATVTIDLDKKSNSSFNEAVQKATGQAHYYELTTNAEESNIRYIEKIDNTQQSDSEIQMEIGISINGLKYKNLKTNEILSDLTPYGMDIILTDSIRKYDWKITNESKEILGFGVRKAVAKKDSITTLTAWYAPKIPIKNGPDDYAGLPGLILELEAVTQYKQPETVRFTAIEVDVLNQTAVNIEKPEKGKKMSMEEFVEQQKVQYQKQMEMYGGGVDKE